MIDADAPTSEVARMLHGPNPPEIEWRHFLLSRAAEKDRDFPGALAEARRAVMLDPDQPDDRARLASLLARAGMSGDAIREWREVLRIDPQDREAHRALVPLLEQQGAIEEARRHRDWAERLKPRS
jgi:Flp pilus assembly protein TadD